MLLSEADLPLTFTAYLATKGLYDVENLTQSQFSTNYTAWLTLVFNTDAIQSWLATKGYSYPDGQFTVSLNQNSGSLLPTISYKSGGVTITIDQATLDALFSNKEAVDVSTGKVLQERWYADLNNAPVVKTIADQSFDEDHPVSFSIPAGTFTDVDSANLTYTATLADNAPLPPWLTFNSATQTFSGTPPQNYNGELSLKVTVSDGLLSASSSFKLTINPVNDAPTGTVTISGTAEEDQTLTASNTLSDDDGLGPITYQWLRDGEVIIGATGETYTLTQADVGHEITVKANYTDQQGTAESVTSDPTGPVANVDDAPTGTVTISGTAEEDQTLTASNDIADEDGVASVTYQWYRDGAAIANATGATYQLTQADVSTAITVKATATDAFGNVVDFTSDPTGPVANVNDAPTGTASAVLAAGTEDTAYTITRANLLAGFSDEDGDVLSVTGLSSNDGTWAENENGSWTFTPSLNFNGTVSLSYNVIDGHGGSVGGTQSFTMAAVNDAPTISGLENKTISENQAGVLIDTFTVSDVDTAGGLTFRVLNGATVDTRFEIVNASGTVMGEPGVYELRLKAGASLDYEAENADGNPVIGLTVEVNDGADEHNIATAPIAVTVGDVVEATLKTMTFDSATSNNPKTYTEGGLILSAIHQNDTLSFGNFISSDSDLETRAIHPDSNPLQFTKEGGGSFALKSVYVQSGSATWIGYNENGVAIASLEINNNTGTGKFYDFNNDPDWEAVSRVEWVVNGGNGSAQIIDNLIWA